MYIMHCMEGLSLNIDANLNHCKGLDIDHDYQAQHRINRNHESAESRVIHGTYYLLLKDVTFLVRKVDFL